MGHIFFNRDLSWLLFNERVLGEAARETVPLLERVMFLSIYSSNLDEFFRVRMPVLKALHKLGRDGADYKHGGSSEELLSRVNDRIHRQQEQFGRILAGDIIPALRENGLELVYGEAVPAELSEDLTRYFLDNVLTFLHPVLLDEGSGEFFPENNKLYFLITLRKEDGQTSTIILNIPSDELPRFYSKRSSEGTIYIVFLDDVVKYNVHLLFKGCEITGCYSFKVTRDAELDLAGEFPSDLLEEISRQISKRDMGLATRFLHQPGIPDALMKIVKRALSLKHAQFMEGGVYHNLRDLKDLPYKSEKLSNPRWYPVGNREIKLDEPIYKQVETGDIIIHPPYQSYNTVLRFFNEASTDPHVTEIYITLYRVASKSSIVNALINAARNGKTVTVLVELKARFDEANNIKWAKRMKDAGVKIIYSISSLKVHAKIALVKRRTGLRSKYTGLLATGNFNENTASVYTDHVLVTAHSDMLREIELLFIFLARRERPHPSVGIRFDHLLVSQFNLLERFVQLIDREINFAREGREASLVVKLNNLEEEVLINKLYEASAAGVKVQLIVRGICCLVPGRAGLSENIRVIRIVDRYLEHGRLFVFNNGGKMEVFMGSADWMKRNIYHRIEVCFPIYNQEIKEELLKIIDLQLSDNVQAVRLDEDLENIPLERTVEERRSQEEIYQMLLLKNK